MELKFQAVAEMLVLKTTSAIFAEREIELQVAHIEIQ